jgi:hypothetical protein
MRFPERYFFLFHNSNPLTILVSIPFKYKHVLWTAQFLVKRSNEGQSFGKSCPSLAPYELSYFIRLCIEEALENYL